MDNEILDQLWDQALCSSMCKCNNDSKWEQERMGFIFCAGCRSWVIEPPDLAQRLEDAPSVTDYVFEDGKGVSGVLLPDGNFIKCGNAEHHLVLTKIPQETQFQSIYFSSMLEWDYFGNITHAPMGFFGVTAAQLRWIEQNAAYLDEGQRIIDINKWKKRYSC